jgi:hypothetical protein
VLVVAAVILAYGAYLWWGVRPRVVLEDDVRWTRGVVLGWAGVVVAFIVAATFTLEGGEMAALLVLLWVAFSAFVVLVFVSAQAKVRPRPHEE